MNPGNMKIRTKADLLLFIDKLSGELQSLIWEHLNDKREAELHHYEDMERQEMEEMEQHYLSLQTKENILAQDHEDACGDR